MKKVSLIFACFSLVYSGYAQSDYSKNNSLTQFDNNATPKELHHLGSSPEFPFLQHKSSAREVYNAIKTNERNGTNKRAMRHLDNILMQAGFANGAKDVKPSSITMTYVPVGTKGNMGDGNYNNTYAVLEGDPSMFKAWKVTSESGSYVYFMAKCGNAFYPNTNGGVESKTACLSVPVNLISEPKEVSLGTTPLNTVTDNVYIYYHRKRHKKDEMWHGKPEIKDENPSRPLLISTTKKVEQIPQTYKVSVTTPGDNIKVCADKPADVAANISVEKISEFSGYDPRKSKKEYKQVSKRVYKKALRKMYKAERKEDKVAYFTGVPVKRD